MSWLPPDFHFLRPWWLLVLLTLPLLPAVLRRVAGAADPWRRVVDPHLLPHLQDRQANRASRGLHLLALAGVVVAVLALAGPAWQRLPQPLLRADSALVLALDLSAGMRATDLAPDRLTRARYKLADLLRVRTEGQTALVVYAGDAFTVAPLTSDAATLESLLAALEADLLPTPGQRPERAIEQALELLRGAGFAHGDLLLLTDRAGPDALAAAQRARAGGLRVSVLGVGTPQGAPLPQPGGGFVRNAGGEVAMATLDERGLRAVAEAGGGRYARLAADEGDLRALRLLDVDPESGLVETEALGERYRDEGPWLLLLLLPLAAAGFRRGWLACLPLLVLGAPGPAQASVWESLWARPDQRAWNALHNDQPQRAAELARDPALRGSAAYRGGDFADAAEAFAQGSDADHHYNRGNALARAGRLQEALGAYDAALALSPGMEDALANRAVVEEALRQQPPSQGAGSPDQDREGTPEAGSEPSDSQPEEGDQTSQDARESSDQSHEPGQDPSDQGEAGSETNEDTEPDDAETGDPTQREAEQQAFSEAMEKALAEEAAEAEPEASPDPADAEARERQEFEQALEQRLRRVPDDPGGLLRRKFALEYQRRLREGRED